jgi:hypothetical protein
VWRPFASGTAIQRPRPPPPRVAPPAGRVAASDGSCTALDAEYQLGGGDALPPQALAPLFAKSAEEATPRPAAPPQLPVPAPRAGAADFSLDFGEVGVVAWVTAPAARRSPLITAEVALRRQAALQFCDEVPCTLVRASSFAGGGPRPRPHPLPRPRCSRCRSARALRAVGARPRGGRVHGARGAGAVGWRATWIDV